MKAGWFADLVARNFAAGLDSPENLTPQIRFDSPRTSRTASG